MSGIRGAYVSGVKTLRKAAQRAGLLARLERSESPTVRHLRTLFSIFDASDLVWLDARPGARVFEYGAGASTVWLARRAGEVHSVEHDVEWAERVRRLLADAPGVHLHAVAATPATAGTRVRSGRVGHSDLDFDDYVATIHRVGGAFDLIVVDGRARNDAFRHSLDHLAEGGIILFDDIKRKRYWNVVSATDGLRLELLTGATPTLPYPTTTGLFWRD